MAKGSAREFRVNMKLMGIGSAITQIGFLGFSFLFLQLGVSRAEQAERNLERANIGLLRSIEDVRLANLRFGETTAEVVALQGNLADIQSLVEQATREVGAAQVAYLMAVRDSGAGSIEAALALDELIASQEEWGTVLSIGLPLVNAATTGLEGMEDSTMRVTDAQADLEAIMIANRIQLVMMGTFITGTAFQLISLARAFQTAAIGSAALKAFGGPAGIAMVIAGAAALTFATGVITGAIPLQQGGLVTRPTLAQLGERGPEAVIPLERFRPIVRETIEVPVFIDSELVEKAIVRRNRQ